MSASVFDDLAERFSDCRKEIDSDKVMSDGDVPSVMFTAGKVLFTARSSNNIDLGDTPKWFRIKPEGTTTGSNGKDFVVQSWDLYWLSAIDWLADNKSDSGITFSLCMYGLNPERYLYIGKNITEFLTVLLQLRHEDLQRAWSQLAAASQDACSYLAREVVKEPRGGRKKKYTPAKIKNMQVSFCKHVEENKGIFYAWNCVAKEHGIKSGKAAEMAVRRHLKKNK
jgi:hypothetical protein